MCMCVYVCVLYVYMHTHMCVYVTNSKLYENIPTMRDIYNAFYN